MIIKQGTVLFSSRNFLISSKEKKKKNHKKNLPREKETHRFHKPNNQKNYDPLEYLITAQLLPPFSITLSRNTKKINYFFCYLNFILKKKEPNRSFLKRLGKSNFKRILLCPCSSCNNDILF